MQNTNTDGTEDFGSQGPQDNPEGGDAPEAWGPESLTSRDGPGVEDTERLKPQEVSGPSGPTQSYVIKSAPWTILRFRILGIFSVENMKRLCVIMFQTCSNSQLLRRVL